MTMRRYFCFFHKNNAVSAVVGILVFTLVSVASASVFFVWQSDWQEEVVDSVDSFGENKLYSSVIRVSGSCSVYKFSYYAQEAFLNENHMVSFVDGWGESSTGIYHAGIGGVDIGRFSWPLDEEYVPENLPDLDGDGEKDLNHEFVDYTVGYGVVVVATAPNTNIDSYLPLTKYTPRDLINDSSIQFFDFSATGTGLEYTDYPNSLGPGYSVTETLFTNFMLDCENALRIEDAVNHEINREVDESFDTNQDIITALQSTTNAWGIVSYPVVRNDPLLTVYGFQGDNDGSSLLPDNHIQNLAYDGCRPLNYVTVDEATGVIKDFIDFCRLLGNNEVFCEQSDYVSIYADYV